jgi:hypothetical protein
MATTERPALGDLLVPGSDYLARSVTKGASRVRARPTAIDVRTAICGLAILSGEDPDAVIADWEHGGALARVVEKLAGGERRRGRKPKTRENWRRFVLVVLAKRDAGPGQDPYALAAAAGEQDGDPEDTQRERYRSSYRRGLQPPHRWTDADVPLGLAALFSEPPAR